MDDLPRRAGAHDLRERLQRLEVLLVDGDRAVLEGSGLTPTHVHALRVLVDGSGTTVSGLAERLLCTRGNAARLVRRLVATGLVAVRDDPDDHRLVLASTTDLGRTRLAAAEAQLKDLDDRRFAVLDTPSLEDLLTAVATLEAHLGSPRRTTP